MTKYIIKRGFTFLKEPGVSFEKEWNTTLSDAFKYILVLGIIAAFLETVVVSLTRGFSIPLFPDYLITGFTFPLSFLTNLAGIYALILGVSVVWGLWLHIWAYGLKAKSGVGQTFKSVFYGQTPTYLLGWIPFVGFGAFAWSMILTGIGIKKLHFVDGIDAALAIIMALFMSGVAILFFYFFI